MEIDQITPLILTLNEQENIGRTLSALAWARQIVVLDSYSTDDTIAVAKKYPHVTIVQRNFDDHTSQWNFGLDQVSTEWVLSLDADYEVSPTLKDEISSLAPDEPTSGYAADFEYRIFGRSLRASVYPPRVILFRRSRGRYVSDGHTQLLKIDGAVRKLKAPVYHDDRKPLSRWLASQDIYSQIEAIHLLQVSRSELKLQDKLRLTICCAPIIMFLYLMFGRGLILDGWRGWYYVAQRVIAELSLSLRLIEQKIRN